MGKQEATTFRSGFVTIVGSPNVGKSTLMNALVGQKVAIVSKKPQTTRSRIRGIVNLPQAQMVLIDTPGIQAPRNRLGDYMLKTSYSSLRDGDAALFLIDPVNGLRERDEEILGRLEKTGLPCVVAINKIDVATPAQIEAVETKLAEKSWLRAVYQISARTGTGLDVLLNGLSGFLEPGPQFFPDDMVTDQPERTLCEEFVREACLLSLSEEVPHGIAVEIEKIQQRDDRPLMDVWANIYCEKEGHKRILIGSKGSMLKKIGTIARRQMEWLFDCNVNLQLWVKVKENWRDKPRDLHALGFRDDE